MKRTTIVLALLLLFTWSAEAQHITGWAEAAYDTTNDQVLGICYTELDYDSMSHYRAFVSCTMVDANGNQMAYGEEEDFSSAGHVEVDLQAENTSYDPGSEFRVIPKHWATQLDFDENPDCGEQRCDVVYFDPDNFGRFAGLSQTYGPWADFFGPGPFQSGFQRRLKLGDTPKTVKKPCAKPVNWTQTALSGPSGGNFHFDYTWESSTGPNRAYDLAASGCSIREEVWYPGSSGPGVWYSWASPPYYPGSTSPNPDSHSVAVELGHATDDHTPKPWSYGGADDFNAIQYYKYSCTCSNETDVVLAGPMWIHRKVEERADHNWKYTITKSGITATLDPIPF